MPPVWKKFISPEDEALWESRMEVQAEGRFAITSVAGRQRLKVEVFLDEGEDDDGSGFVQAFGGSVVALADEDWQSVQVRPILVKVRDRLVITSTTEPEAQARLRKTYPGRKLIIIPAELAFGTGEHETTATCLRFLVDVAKERDSWSLLDLGTGTGILAIAAKLLGASQVLGWENDPLAVPVADRNVLTHGLAQDAVKIEAEDVLAWEPQEAAWDVITANMFSEILIATFPKMRQVLKSDGTLIISGILREQETETLAAAEKAGFAIMNVKRVGKWVTARTA
ncbi:50S ribosomal protein L11 methyltransferase [Verrucomicrobiales bacterium]|jgi:ribosomal protein L11 methyltransferase|nr:50S ribosomal protein L11 methyltransferase [Verrucomicrobiales bacterium]MDB2346817.1 50S ribosomal protein L11 methyltransferase [Verrucomicrobiales bacterium]MDC0503984.1 50S ribosomal protein L11 methyltransferase [Verrucomicrobiales bacterium]MDF1785041.1 50S ribosomal protein L11 methyltransferase [Verrucomicrobiales bacterium]